MYVCLYLEGTEWLRNAQLYKFLSNFLLFSLLISILQFCSNFTAYQAESTDPSRSNSKQTTRCSSSAHTPSVHAHGKADSRSLEGTLKNESFKRMQMSLGCAGLPLQILGQTPGRRYTQVVCMSSIPISKVQQFNGEPVS